MESRLTITIELIAIIVFFILLVKGIAQEIGESIAHRIFYNKKKAKIRTLLNDLNEKVEERIKEIEAGEKAKAKAI